MKKNRTPIKFSARSLAALGLITAAVFGCSPIEDTRGNLPLAEVIEKLKPGKQSREQVARMLGTPSTTATFEKQEVWYYIGERTETLAFFSPKILERKVLMIRFTKLGLLQDIAKFNASDAKPITLVQRITPTKGKELGFFEQIVGNIGRFSDPEDEK